MLKIQQLPYYKSNRIFFAVEITPGLNLIIAELIHKAQHFGLRTMFGDAFLIRVTQEVIGN